MKKTEIISNTQKAIAEYKDMFDTSQYVFKCAYDEYEWSFEGQKYLEIYFPRKISLDTIDGLKLKDDKGFILIHETYIYSNQHTLYKKGYIYKYITPEFSYHCTHPTSNQSEKFNYNFHYDMDLEYKNRDDKKLESTLHPDYHLQVLHTSPRFSAPKMEITNFLLLIRNLLYENNSSMTTKGEFIFQMK